MSVADVERFMAPTRCMGTAPSSSAMRSDLDGDRPKAFREKGMSRMSRSPSSLAPWKLFMLFERGRCAERVLSNAPFVGEPCSELDELAPEFL
jgi:hypothetical protein